MFGSLPRVRSRVSAIRQSSVSVASLGHSKLEVGAKALNITVRALKDRARRRQVQLVGLRRHQRISQAEIARLLSTPTAKTRSANDSIPDGRAESRAATDAAAARFARRAAR